MVYVPAGTFEMGSKRFPALWPIHDVLVQAFHISKYETTNKQFKSFLDANPQWRKDRIASKYHDGGYLKHWQGDTYPSGEGDHPVVWVSWFAAKAYCEWAGGRLPTEAEWEYACRAGSTTEYCFGDVHSQLGDNAWYRRNANRRTHPVGQKKPNHWGLHDVHGNVWEWTSSIYKDYPYVANDGREDPKDTGSSRVLRGGSFLSTALFCRAAYRLSLHRPTRCYVRFGFRLCVPGEIPR